MGGLIMLASLGQHRRDHAQSLYLSLRVPYAGGCLQRLLGPPVCSERLRRPGQRFSPLVWVVDARHHLQGLPGGISRQLSLPGLGQHLRHLS